MGSVSAAGSGAAGCWCPTSSNVSSGGDTFDLFDTFERWLLLKATRQSAEQKRWALPAARGVKGS